MLNVALGVLAILLASSLFCSLLLLLIRLCPPITSVSFRDGLFPLGLQIHSTSDTMLCEIPQVCSQHNPLVPSQTTSNNLNIMSQPYHHT